MRAVFSASSHSLVASRPSAASTFLRPVPRSVRTSLSPRWWFAAKAVLAVVAVASLVRLVHPADVRAALAAADVRWLGVGLALLPLNVALEALRFGRLVQRVAPGVRLRDAMAAVVGAYPLGLLTPARVGDYVGRAALLPGVPAGTAAALTVGERMATLLACLAGGLAALQWNPAAALAPAAAWTAVAVWAALGTAVLTAAFASPERTARALSAVVPVAAVRRALAAFGEVPRAEAGVLVALSAARYAVFSAQFAVFVHAFAPSAAWGAVVAGVAVVYLVKSAVPQLTLGDLGVREGVAVFVLGGAGVAPAEALNAALAVFVVNLVLPALAGVPLLARLRLGAARRTEERLGARGEATVAEPQPFPREGGHGVDGGGARRPEVSRRLGAESTPPPAWPPEPPVGGDSLTSEARLDARPPAEHLEAPRPAEVLA